VISAKCSSTKGLCHTLCRINRNDGHSVRSVLGSCYKSGRKRIGGGDVQLFLLLFIVAVTLCACQNPGRFQAPQVAASHFCVGQC
jgi:hypothetical protein